MALYTKSGLAQYCGVSKGAVSLAISRDHKLIVNNGQIDDQNPVNAATIADWLAKKATKEEENPHTEKISKQPKSNQSSLQAGEMGSISAIRLKGEILKNIKTAEEIEWKQLQNTKARGEMIPTELAQNAAAQLGKALGTAHQQFMEDFITLFAKRYGLTNEDVANVRGEMIKHINQATEEGTATAMQTIEVLANEYAIKKGVGEHN